MKETKSPCKNQRSTKFWKGWNKSMLRSLNFILRPKTRNKWPWRKTKFKNWSESSPTCTQLWTLKSKKKKTSWEESTPKRSTKESIQSRKSNFLFNLSYCEDIYNAGKFNFTVMEWAIKEIIKEEREEEEMKKKAEEERKANGQEVATETEGKNNFLKKASWGLVLLPIAGILINQFLMFWSRKKWS